MHKTITLELPTDDTDVYAALELCCDALIAWGFHRDSVADCLDKDFAEYNLGITPTKYDFDGLDLPEEAEKYVPPFEGSNPYKYTGMPPGETGLPGESVCSTEDKDRLVTWDDVREQSNIPRELSQEECEDFCNNYGKEDDGLGDEHLADYTGEDTDEKI